MLFNPKFQKFMKWAWIFIAIIIIASMILVSIPALVGGY
jgi:hypothetical protein